MPRLIGNKSRKGGPYVYLEKSVVVFPRPKPDSLVRR